MKKRLLIILLLMSFLGCYLEWGTNQHLFIGEAVVAIAKKTMQDPLSLIHPFIIIPFSGMVMLTVSLFQNKPGKIITLLALACLGILPVFLFVIGAMMMNLKILLSTLPFLVVGLLLIAAYSNKKEIQLNS